MDGAQSLCVCVSHLHNAHVVIVCNINTVYETSVQCSKNVEETTSPLQMSAYIQ